MTLKDLFRSWCMAMAGMGCAGLALSCAPAPKPVPRDTPTNNYPADCENPELSKPSPGWRTIQPGDRSWNPVGWQALPAPYRAPRLKASLAAAMPGAPYVPQEEP